MKLTVVVVTLILMTLVDEGATWGSWRAPIPKKVCNPVCTTICVAITDCPKCAPDCHYRCDKKNLHMGWTKKERTSSNYYSKQFI